MTTSSITVHLLSLPLHRRHHQPRRHHHHCYDIYSKNLIRGIPAQFDWKRLQINYESSFPTKEESCKINICNPGIWKGYRCWRWWSKRITTLTISSRDIQTQILLTYLNMYMFSLTSMYSKQILGFIIYFWIDSYIDWIVILFEKEGIVIKRERGRRRVEQRYLCHHHRGTILSVDHLQLWLRSREDIARRELHGYETALFWISL